MAPFMNHKITWLILSGIILATACSPLKKAHQKFQLAEYEEAIDMFDRLADKPEYYAEANFMMAESYRQSNRIWQAVPYYEKATTEGFENDSSGFFYAFALKATGDYEGARDILGDYLAKADEYDPENKKYLAMANREMENLNEIDELKENKSYFDVQNLEDLNTNGPEYSPFVRDGRFYFTSSRDDQSVYKSTGTGYTDVYVAQFKDNKVNAAAVKGVGDFINTYGIHEASLAIAPNGKTMIFARSNTGKKKGRAEVDLYITRYRNKAWTKPTVMNISSRDDWDSSPAFSRDGRTLYFASNRPGGNGGTDIWVAHLGTNGRWGKPKAMGSAINTSGNELFPFVSDDGKLYFASDGHPGLGGLDVFEATRRRGKIIVKNMGAPVNTNADDFGFMLYSPNEGFLTSNRAGGKGDDDIYSFVNNDPNIKVVHYFLEGKTVTMTEAGEQILPNVRLRLMDDEENVYEIVNTDSEGRFSFRIDPEVVYILVGEKANYFTTRELYSTVGRSVDPNTLTQYETDIVFDTTLVLDPILLNVDIELENIYYDLAKWDIREDAAEELDKLAELLKDNPEVKIELSSHTDARAGDDYNMDLSQKRATSAVEYLISQGIEDDRMVARGYGETKLLNECANGVDCSEEKHQRNRRTEFKVIEYDQEILEEKSKEEDLEDRLFNDGGE